ncbi:MAG: ABC transporter ATP-binding protein [Rubrivivax sp.]|nr:ABC transporter ATP-binding protein [Rubrivivax sp.]MBK7260476.1 ABC transporter ATP-binding protein [Rubrivivax sp.]MBK8526152.1 ABC transporter ATP-binding protein [Rubrivivax sp.]
MSDVFFRAEGVCSGYGRGDIVSDVNVAVESGSIMTIIGPNGAGKSTFIKTLAGVVQRRTGKILIDGHDVGGLPPSEVSRHAIAYVPQEHNVFRSLSVVENFEMGAWIEPRKFKSRMESVLELFPALRTLRAVKAGNLSGGQRQMVAFGMALMVEPKLLLLDEPSAGLSPAMVEQMFEAIRQVRERGIAILMVEQNAMQALQISNFGTVMTAGRVAMTGPASELLNNREVAELYLGTRA